MILDRKVITFIVNTYKTFVGVVSFLFSFFLFLFCCCCQQCTEIRTFRDRSPGQFAISAFTDFDLSQCHSVQNFSQLPGLMCAPVNSKRD